jgi:hypothetical protein
MLAELNRAQHNLHGRLRPQASQEKRAVAGRLTPGGPLLLRFRDNLCPEEGTRFRQPSHPQRNSLRRNSRQCNNRRRAVANQDADGMPAELSRLHHLRGLRLRLQSSRLRRNSLQRNSPRRAVASQDADGMQAELSRLHHLRGLHLRLQFNRLRRNSLQRNSLQ